MWAESSIVTKMDRNGQKGRRRKHILFYLFVLCQLSHVMFHMSYVVCRVSGVTCHLRQQPQILPLITPPLCIIQDPFFLPPPPSYKSQHFAGLVGLQRPKNQKVSKPKNSWNNKNPKMSWAMPMLTIRSSTRSLHFIRKQGFTQWHKKTHLAHSLKIYIICNKSRHQKKNLPFPFQGRLQNARNVIKLICGICQIMSTEEVIVSIYVHHLLLL